MFAENSDKDLRRTVLVAEDDDSMRRFLEVTLERENLAVLPAGDGLEALEIVFDRHVDAIITDAVMPNMSGFDLCRILRKNPDKKTIPIILLTGFDQTDEAATVECKPDRYLTKGKNLKERLLKALSELIPSIGSQ